MHSKIAWKTLFFLHNHIAYEFFFQQFIIYLNKEKNTNLLKIDWIEPSIVKHIVFI